MYALCVCMFICIICVCVLKWSPGPHPAEDSASVAQAVSPDILPSSTESCPSSSSRTSGSGSSPSSCAMGHESGCWGLDKEGKGVMGPLAALRIVEATPMANSQGI